MGLGSEEWCSGRYQKRRALTRKCIRSLGCDSGLRKHVLEKPACLEVEELDELIQIAKEKNLFFMEAV
ncbi:uncharacterized protein IAS62_006242 [Cryptococcus decagattii]|uniref:Uncharacterized protein n=1 Tax=Cryptococcus decagattii TaxID=1859122 RepID=A0ABZ2AT33_9TREE